MSSQSHTIVSSSPVDNSSHNGEPHNDRDKSQRSGDNGQPNTNPDDENRPLTSVHNGQPDQTLLGVPADPRSRRENEGKRPSYPQT
ncbi:hypothetical protein GX50_04131 [[Emmonsia] crescens]|uniref:Uncharacterized protein n=1 Tax=[Emmonsia] crescens TaxID=73230 RepID=A0A2B7ZJQ2_9EURO|nr:hypothetical protein GX50_04131 [Emmonsia crescens]